MKQTLFAIALLLCIGAPARSQDAIQKMKIRAVLVDVDLNQKPVPHLDVIVSSEGGAVFVRQIKTDLSGSAEIAVAPGKYRITTPLGIDFQGRHYAWEIEAGVGGEPVSVDLSNDNARVATLNGAAVSPPARHEPAHVGDLESLFQKYQNSVVTVWSEIGSGTGFIIDSSGLIMTNQHVIGASEFVAVQFDSKRKVAAKVLATDAERDVAVVCADLSTFPGATAAPIANPPAGRDPAVEGEQVFTIGSPLGLKKIITSGIISKIEARALISDININPGNSGGPLFDPAGEVLGITTFGVQRGGGPGIAGIVRIEETQLVAERARRKRNLVPLPSARLLPVEPAEPYPLTALKKLARSGGVDQRLYTFAVGPFDVMLETPPLIYRLQEKPDIQAVKEKEKRDGIHDSSLDDLDPLLDRHAWEEYAGEYRPVLTIDAEAQLHEKLSSMFGRELLSSFKPPYLSNTKHLNFRTDFDGMKLLCGGQEIEPIHRFRSPRIKNGRDDSVAVTDATYTGSYVYGPGAISPSCGKVTIELYSEKDPKKAFARDLDRKTIDRVWDDFRPYIQMPRASSPKDE